jgi:hypothetical protein
MTNVFHNLVRAVVLLPVLAMAAGCVFTVPTNPDAYPVVAPEFQALPAGTKVELVNGFSRSYMARMANNQQADLQQFTQTAITALGRALEKKGAILAAGGAKVTLEATGPTLTPGFGFVRCSISLNVDLGGTKLSTWGDASGIDSSKNFSSAITNAVEDLLRKPEFRSYVTGS